MHKYWEFISEYDWDTRDCLLKEHDRLSDIARLLKRNNLGLDNEFIFEIEERKKAIMKLLKQKDIFEGMIKISRNDSIIIEWISIVAEELSVEKIERKIEQLERRINLLKRWIWDINDGLISIANIEKAIATLIWVLIKKKN